MAFDLIKPNIYLFFAGEKSKLNRMTRGTSIRIVKFEHMNNAWQQIIRGRFYRPSHFNIEIERITP